MDSIPPQYLNWSLCMEMAGGRWGAWLNLVVSHFRGNLYSPLAPKMPRNMARVTRGRGRKFLRFGLLSAQGSTPYLLEIPAGQSARAPQPPHICRRYSRSADWVRSCWRENVIGCTRPAGGCALAVWHLPPPSEGGVLASVPDVCGWENYSNQAGGSVHSVLV